MKPNQIATVALVMLLGAPALAQDAPAVEDTDGDGSYSLAELQVAYPDLTEEGYASIDANADGVVDEAELAAAVADGLAAPSNG
ncbi:MAG: EF-hand domain-containing protein [Paracoccaceae bacterium]